MNLPKTVKIGGLAFKITLVDEIEGDKEAEGITDHKALTIKLVKGEQQGMECTFIHEILHAINIDWNEERVEFVAMSLYQILIDNPGIFEFKKGGKNIWFKQ